MAWNTFNKLRHNAVTGLFATSDALFSFAGSARKHLQSRGRSEVAIAALGDHVTGMQSSLPMATDRAVWENPPTSPPKTASTTPPTSLDRSNAQDQTATTARGLDDGKPFADSHEIARRSRRPDIQVLLLLNKATRAAQGFRGGRSRSLSARRAAGRP